MLTKPPIAKGGGVYAVTVYDPFHDGEQTIDITPNPKDADTFIFTTNDLTVDGSSAGSSTYDFEDVIKRLQKTNYDLSIPIITGREYLAQAKQGALQTDGHNCTLWSLFYAAMANAMKPGFNTFKGVGLEKWQRDFGFTLRTYESVTGKPPLAIKLGEPA
ncbi:hypothetical protein A3B57_02625 [Microgenomates group bacterium RIFCSPLOWO2_01_FULL_47_10]|nr:MAG: hypothetical protein A3B57_02625 [Microgenomates group bacterium RIFCSPLOWO2_01_FULL_47_10]